MPEPGTPLLELRNVRKVFGSLVAVGGVSFNLKSGECLGLLGPNGAGKTTTISMIAGLVMPDSGEVLVGGQPYERDDDPRRALLGLVPQDLALYEELPAQDNLEFFGALYSIEKSVLRTRMADALEIVGLTDRARDKVKNYSGGMKRRLNLAVALLHDPQILLLDEPTVGVDPQSRNAIFDNIEALRKRGKTIVYTTHYMEEVERLCERVIIMDHGKVLADDTVAGLKRRTAGPARLIVDLVGSCPQEVLVEIGRLAGIAKVETQNHRLLVETSDLGQGTAAVVSLINSRGLKVLHVESETPDLETVFLSLTGRTLRDS